MYGDNIISLRDARAIVPESTTVAHNTIEKSDPFGDLGMLDFPVTQRDLAFYDGSDSYRGVGTHKAVVRTDNNREDLLGVVGIDYQIVPNDAFFGAVETAFTDQMRPDYLDSAQVMDRISRNGAFSLREYRFPALKVDVGGATVAYRAFAWNTYDGTGSVKLCHGAIDFFCTNGMVFGEYSTLSRRHTAGFNMPNFERFVTKGLEDWQKNARRLEVWAATTITRAQAEQCIRDLPGVSDRKAERLLDQYDVERSDRGASVWALYSALTYYATHNDEKAGFRVRRTGNDNEAETLAKREIQVSAWTRSNAFNRLLAA